MSWFQNALDRLVQQPCCGYLPEGVVSVEPTALAAMALVRCGAGEAAARALDRLLKLQNKNGSLGVSAALATPCWGTGWAVQAWSLASKGGLEETGPHEDWLGAANKAIAWMRSVKGLAINNDDKSVESFFAHDLTLQGWPWVESTHSWVEPTAMNVLALKSMGKSADARTREAVRMLEDRMLPAGGWNYGNTIVLGNTLRDHIQPTGLTLWALAHEPSAKTHRAISIPWLEGRLCDRTTTSSLCYALLGLTACGRKIDDARRWLEAAHQRTMARDGSPYKLALLLLAARACE